MPQSSAGRSHRRQRVARPTPPSNSRLSRLQHCHSKWHPGGSRGSELPVFMELRGRRPPAAKRVRRTAEKAALARGATPCLESAAPCGACRSLRTWDLCGLTHPSSLVEWKRLKMMQIRGLPRSAASSARSWSRVVPLWQTGPKVGFCEEIGAFFAAGREARRGEDGERVVAAGPSRGPGACKESCTSASFRRLGQGAAARGASPRRATAGVHGTGFAASNVGKRATTAQSR
jgi:hypothetical protein